MFYFISIINKCMKIYSSRKNKYTIFLYEQNAQFTKPLQDPFPLPNKTSVTLLLKLLLSLVELHVSDNFNNHY